MFHRRPSHFVFALAAAMLAASVAASAQSAAPSAPSAPAGAHHHHHHGWRAALAQLALTTDQKTRIDALVRADRSALETSADAGTPAGRAAYRAKLRSDIETVLTPDQKTQFEASMTHHHARPDAGAPTVSPT